MSTVLADWTGRPKAGERWRAKIDGKSETRRVIDRTLGGHVMFISGRLTAFNRPLTITLSHWNEWQAKAKQVKP